jgi:hypothetical protein
MFAPVTQSVPPNNVGSDLVFAADLETFPISTSKGSRHQRLSTRRYEEQSVLTDILASVDGNQINNIYIRFEYHQMFLQCVEYLCIRPHIGKWADDVLEYRSIKWVVHV